MAILEICLEGEKVLKLHAKPISKITKNIKQLLDDMAETMYAAQGIGLAAPQVGHSVQVVIIDIGHGLIELINPMIIEQEGEDTAVEGCLSLPGVYGEVCRSAMVIVEGYDRTGRKIRVEGKGLLARAIQHELDHLDGTLFIEKAENVERRDPEEEQD